MTRAEHYIVIGDGALALNAWRELTARGQAAIRLLPARASAEGPDSLRGDPGDAEVLRRAGAERAVAVLAMLDDDAHNLSVLRALRTLASPALTVVTVNDSRNLPRIRQLRPGAVIAPLLEDGVLAARIVHGEQIPSDLLPHCVLQQGEVEPA
ncbi:NAD-binding protein [Pseudomonas delhiensis]|uniref:NAD-binding protein n=1 Tax=Pseudomonas delhiensis TaxID=366289 RepID=UPI00315A5508